MPAQAQLPAIAPPSASPASVRCPVPSPSDAEMRAVGEEVDAFLARNGVPESGTVTIPVAFHVLRSGEAISQGNVPDQWIADQIDVLNESFDGTTGGYDTNFRFVLDRITRTTNAAWYTGCFGALEDEIKQALGVNPASTLNVYSCRPSGGVLGSAVFPWSYPEDDYRHGVILLDQALPGGSVAPYNEGDVAVHQVGHYLGLLHTFGGCTDDEPPDCELTGDLVCDTPSASAPGFGCPVGIDSCLGGGPDPIHNFMHTTDDACMYEFTQGQSERMDEIAATYRPTLLLGGGCEQTLAVTLDDPTPTPGQTVTFSVTVTNDGAAPAPVDLWLDATGPARRTVRLGSGTLPAGATVTRQVNLRIPANAPSGAYTFALHLGDFATLAVCDTVTFDVTISAPVNGEVEPDREALAY